MTALRSSPAGRIGAKGCAEPLRDARAASRAQVSETTSFAEWLRQLMGMMKQRCPGFCGIAGFSPASTLGTEMTPEVAEAIEDAADVVVQRALEFAAKP